jgi:hypothetical protein
MAGGNESDVLEPSRGGRCGPEPGPPAAAGGEAVADVVALGLKAARREGTWWLVMTGRGETNEPVAPRLTRPWPGIPAGPRWRPGRRRPWLICDLAEVIRPWDHASLAVRTETKAGIRIWQFFRMRGPSGFPKRNYTLRGNLAASAAIRCRDCILISLYAIAIGRREQALFSRPHSGRKRSHERNWLYLALDGELWQKAAPTSREMLPQVHDRAGRETARAAAGVRISGPFPFTPSWIGPHR